MHAPKAYLNMEGVVFKTTNSPTTSHAELEDNSNKSLIFKVLWGNWKVRNGNPTQWTASHNDWNLGNDNTR